MSDDDKKFKRYNQIEHALARPGMYIGDIKYSKGYRWIITETNNLEKKLINWNPGLYKIIDEIITNAMDESIRHGNVKNIKINIDEKTGKITIYNDGVDIPIKKHDTYNIYIPELIFGNMLSSSNYDDNEKRLVGGLNGLGAKLTNIYSNYFSIEICNRGKKYIQHFEKNMSVINNPIISDSKDNGIKIIFIPDYERFGVKFIDRDMINVIKKRSFDIGALTPKKVNVYFNDEKIKINNFPAYIDLFSETKVYEKVSDRWEVGASLSSGEFSHVSFVNGVFTEDGGSHVEHVSSQIVKQIATELQSKYKNITIKSNYIKENLCLYINCKVENPTFSSQSKDKLVTKVSDFGTKCQLSTDMIKKISKLGFIDKIIEMAKARDKKQLSKTDGKKNKRLLIDKLDDAINAGTKHSNKCTLILTEGDSAKTMAISGLSVIGRENYGIFPLKGKLLNTRTATTNQLLNNEEINNIKKIIGLQEGFKYKDTSSLRYGKILIMTDQDTDGFHIKSLIINFIDNGWPELLSNLFIESFITPIIKASKDKCQTLEFYNIPEYKKWKDENGKGNWKIKYYKGLGTSSPAETKEYFKNMKKVGYKIYDDDDKDALDLAFSKIRTDDRKKWIIENSEKDFSHSYSGIKKIKDLINNELVLFSISDNVRSIPSVIDGLKPSQRKVLYSCFKRKLYHGNEIKVSQLAGYVSEKTCYHHGEASLMDTIINMAQNFIGSNNMNLLYPSGQFGTRLIGGKDSSSPRYIFTHLSENVEKLFDADDEKILEYLDDDGQKIEPKYYVPLLPIILINGSQGIGTGFSTNIPCYNPEDIKKCLKSILDETPQMELTPWYNNFRGEIKKLSQCKWITSGVFVIKHNKIIVTELPINTWTEDYKILLDKLEADSTIVSYINKSTEEDIYFEITVPPDFQVSVSNIEKTLKLTSTLSCNNMHAFDKDGKIKRYNSPNDIITEFFKIRSEYNILKRDNKIKILSGELLYLEQMFRFVDMIINDKINIYRKSKPDINKILENLKFYKKDDSYNYLLSMPIWSFTYEYMLALENKLKDKKLELNILNNLSSRDMWIKILS